MVLNPDGTENTSSSFIGNINPFRYRGYYYDKETKLYYLQYRYYDPEICRFISPDTLSFTNPKEINGTNLFVFCNNNPIMYRDKNGKSAIAALLIAAGIGALAGLAGQLTSDIVHGALTGNWVFSWQQYLGASLGGAIGGLLYGFGTGGFVTGFVSASVATFTANGLEMLTGDRHADIISLIVDTTASGIIGGIGGALIHMNGINKGSHSLHQIYKSGLTKVRKYSWNISLRTLIKGFGMTYLTDSANTFYDILYSLQEDWRFL